MRRPRDVSTRTYRIDPAIHGPARPVCPRPLDSRLLWLLDGRTGLADGQRDSLVSERTLKESINGSRHNKGRAGCAQMRDFVD